MCPCNWAKSIFRRSWSQWAARTNSIHTLPTPIFSTMTRLNYWVPKTISNTRPLISLPKIIPNICRETRRKQKLQKSKGKERLLMRVVRNQPVKWVKWNLILSREHPQILIYEILKMVVKMMKQWWQQLWLSLLKINSRLPLPKEIAREINRLEIRKFRSK